MSETTAIPTPARWFLGIFAALAVFALVGVYSRSVADHTTGYDDDQAQERYARLAKLQADDAKALTTAGWVDQDKGVVRIPIDEAITQEVDALKAKPVQMGVALPGGAATVPNTIPATNAPPASAAPTNAAPVPPATNTTK